jgi:signal transduction histidine kinase
MSVHHYLGNSVFRVGIDERSKLHPLRTSAVIAVAYVVLISLYILASGRIALHASMSAETLASIELAKGLLFAVVTGVLLFFFTFLMLVRCERLDSVIIAQNKSIIAVERLAIVGIFATSVSHDINNLMSVIVGNIELLKVTTGAGRNSSKALGEMEDASDRLVTLVKRMMFAGRGHIPGKLGVGSLSDLVEDTVEFSKVHRAVKLCRVTSAIEPGIELTMNGALVSRAVMNMILNAAEATEMAGGILIRLQRVGDRAEIEVHDDGPGVDAELEERIFEPFFTSKVNGNGLGLLSLRLCAEQHRGTVRLNRSELGGACFVLSLPLLTEGRGNRSEHEGGCD